MLLRSIYKIITLSLVTSVFFITSVRAETINQETLEGMLKKGEKLVKGYCDAESVSMGSECQDGVTLLEKVVGSDPTNIKALTLLLKGYGNLSPSKGIETAHKLLQLDPKNGEAYYFMGIHSEVTEERVAYLRKAAQYSPNNVWVHGELAWILAHGDINISEAVKEIKKQIKVNPNSSNAVYGVASMLWEKGYKEEFKKIYMDYLKSNTQLTKCGEFAHDALEKLQDQADIVALYKEQCGGYAYYELAKKGKDSKEQISLLKKAAELTPNHLQIHGALAMALLEHEGDVEGAVKEMKQQIKIAAAYASQDILSFGELLRKKNQADKTVDIFETYLRSDIQKEAKCEAFKTLDKKSYERYQQFLSLLKTTCK